MARLPVVVGIGGINSAGRTSGFHGYKRLVDTALSEAVMRTTWQDLAHRMGISLESDHAIDAIKAGTLIRKIDLFDSDNILSQNKAYVDSPNGSAQFKVKKSKLPKQVPSDWIIQEVNAYDVLVSIPDATEVLLSSQKKLDVSSAGCLPSGFNPGLLYPSLNHPRGLMLSVYGASDALHSLGFEWQHVLQYIEPDAISVYAGSCLAQTDESSLGGLISQPLLGNRINSKMLAFSFGEMPADFINSYVLNSIGTTGTILGACASFLYNLKQGIADIQEGRAKVALVGNAEALITPSIIEGFSIMGALATDESLCKLDNVSAPNHRRACRPFSTNTGFTIGEASQFVVLMDDALALALGAKIYGAIGGVFINADANKKSIASPGVGNYATVAKATALAKAILGEEGLKQTYVHAHGTGTPQNRVTESHILNEVAKTFSIKQWPVAAIKSYIGHTLAAAAGDQLIAALGGWEHGWVPGIKTIDHIASDVHQSHLNILRDHYYAGEKGQDMKGVLLNAKGFGGNNATAFVLSPHETLRMLQHKHGSDTLKNYFKKNESVCEQAQINDDEKVNGKDSVIYQFGEAVMNEKDVQLSQEKLHFSYFKKSIDLPLENPYKEYSE